MSKWDGAYNSTYESQRSLEDDILEAGRTGKTCGETSSGGTIRQSDNRIDVYGKSDSPQGHSHDWYNGNTGEKGHHD